MREVKVGEEAAARSVYDHLKELDEMGRIRVIDYVLELFGFSREGAPERRRIRLRPKGSPPLPRKSKRRVNQEGE